MIFKYQRRSTTPTRVGKLTIGGDSPIVVQSMANVPTNEIEQCVKQAIQIIRAGGQMVRFTTQGIREVDALRSIKERLASLGYHTPLVADVHFRKEVAYEAAKVADKVRVNPGNFYDNVIKRGKSFTESEYKEDLQGLEEAFGYFVDLCKERGTAIRIGVNHGSLSGRILDKYGDTPEGMVESCMEYLNICREKGFQDVVISIKSSNTVVMTRTVRLLCDTMDSKGLSYPLHLGVTEAGDGEDGRLKSAIGIGSLLSLGYGDTIRVSLTEAPEAEIPVANLLVKLTSELNTCPAVELKVANKGQVISEDDLLTPMVIVDASYDMDAMTGYTRPDYLFGQGGNLSEEDIEVHTASEIIEGIRFQDVDKIAVVDVEPKSAPIILQAIENTSTPPFVIRMTINAPLNELSTRLGFALGAFLLESKKLRGLWLRSPLLTTAESSRLAYGLLQASRRRITKTEYIACPSCGRTLFDLPDTLSKVRTATQHLKGIKIGVMGCVVNGPGEMADADYGYVGSGVGMIDLYRGQVKVARGIPSSEAVSKLIALIKENGDWMDPD